jgi:hypothetical protein
MWRLVSHCRLLANGDTNQERLDYCASAESNILMLMFVDVDVSASTSIQHTSGFKTNWHLPELVIIKACMFGLDIRYPQSHHQSYDAVEYAIRYVDLIESKEQYPAYLPGSQGRYGNHQSAVVHRPEVKSCNAHVHQIFRLPLSKSLYLHAKMNK